MNPSGHVMPSKATEPNVRTTVSFEELYAKLNDQQKLAVNTIEGPVMVVAGPGTGKTQVVAMRVANILKKTHARPSNILCLTFSTSGATAMRERLRSLIGPDAYGVNVNTIHGFCNDIISQHPHIFEEWAALEQISDVERYRSINRIIDDLMPNLVLVSKKTPYQRTKDIIDRISLMKREGKTLEELQQVADQYEVQLSGLSKEGTKAHEKNVLAARKFHDFVKIFGLYQEMLTETQRYDYDDMILHVIRAFKEEEWLTASLQERFHYVIVDEVQDTNGAQFKVLELLTTYVSGDEPNICVVGDDDQAIYRFQGANLQNILSFKARFPKASVIVLGTSYRCTQSILDSAANLIKNNTERLVGKVDGLTKELVSGKGTAGPAPRMVRTASDVTEPWTVAELIQERLDRGIAPSEIAILTQTNRELFQYYDVLRAKGIPVQMSGKLDLLSHPLVRQALSILRAVHKPEEDTYFSAALSCECFGCHPADIGRLHLLRRDQKTSLYRLLISWEEETSSLKNLPWIAQDALRIARDKLLSLHQQLPNRTIVGTVEHILKDCNLLPTPSEHSPVDLIDFAALQAFFDRIRIRAFEQISFSFDVFMNDLEFYGKEEYGDLRMNYALPHLTEEGVQLMTAHHSKGLEFDVVILPNFREGHWNKRRNPSSLSIPEDLLFGWEKEQKSYEQNQDERRVAYVAMTRAKNELIFTCPKQSVSGDKAKDLSPCAFFAEAENVSEEDHEVKDALQLSTLLFQPLRQMDEEFKAFLRERIANFALSVTSLNHFLEDPQQFLLRDLLQVPELKESSLVYGNAAHSALRRWGLSIQEGLPLSREQFIGEFDNYLTDREILTDAERRNLLAHGQENLRRYYDHALTSFLPFVQRVEFPVKAHLGVIPLKGMIDRIDTDHPDSARATIIDYKTGKPKTENEIREGDYFRQLTFYAVLLQESRSLYEPHLFVLDFIGEGSDHPVKRAFQIGESEKEDLRKVIKDVWGKIVALDFTPL